MRFQIPLAIVAVLIVSVPTMSQVSFVSPMEGRWAIDNGRSDGPPMGRRTNPHEADVTAVSIAKGTKDITVVMVFSERSQSSVYALNQAETFNSDLFGATQRTTAQLKAGVLRVDTTQAVELPQGTTETVYRTDVYTVEPDGSLRIARTLRTATGQYSRQLVFTRAQ